MALDKVNKNGFLEGFESNSIIYWELHKTQLSDEFDNNGYLKSFESDNII